MYQIADQLGLKYGKKFAHEASINANSTVNQRVSPFLFNQFYCTQFNPCQIGGNNKTDNFSTYIYNLRPQKSFVKCS